MNLAFTRCAAPPPRMGSTSDSIYSNSDPHVGPCYNNFSKEGPKNGKISGKAKLKITDSKYIFAFEISFIFISSIMFVV